MQILTKKSRDILECWSEEHNIREISKLSNLKYDIIRNNHFKYFKKCDYLNRISKGRYILNKKGKDKLNKDLIQLESEKIILETSKKKASNKDINKILYKKLNQNMTDSALFSKIYRLRKKHNIIRRHIKEINKINVNKSFYEVLGLISSDGYISKYYIEFSNKDKRMLKEYRDIAIGWGLKSSERISGNNGTLITIHSINFVNLINKYLNNKKRLSKEIIYGERKLQNAFLKGLFSGDGCVSISISFRKNSNTWRVESCVSLAAKNENIKYPAYIMLKNLGYTPNLGDKNVWIRKKEDISKFRKEIGFVGGSKIRKSKSFKGLEKNKLLDYVVKNLQKDRILKKLKTQKDKEKIVNHIIEESL